MKRTIEILKEIKKDHECKFIYSSLIIHSNKGFNKCIPDTSYDLDMILELKEAISTLENTAAVKETICN
tara:strand:- start:322 stop:528 length:207 start_codon:yes stop_codon:yes gene_type:complete